MQDSYTETIKCCWKKLKKTWINGKPSWIHGLEDLVLLRWYYFPYWSTDSMQSLSEF